MAARPLLAMPYKGWATIHPPTLPPKYTCWVASVRTLVLEAAAVLAEMTQMPPSTVNSCIERATLAESHRETAG
eukprot:scaffold60477_cov50-Attheya_sp.AAC.3